MNNIKKQISQIFSDERNILISLMLFGLISKLFNLTSPLLDYHSWRQTDTAGIARNFYNNGFNIIYPQIDWGGAGPGYVESEFQLVPFISSLFYKIFGVHEYIARLVVIAFSVGSIYLLYRMIRMHYSQRVAAFSIIFFIISPLELYFGRAVMPESAMIFFSIGSLYFFDKWTKGENINTFILALI
jgi:4-amino-4-deoxy-L-arabinose transferase-like glycosyltransferase